MTAYPVAPARRDRRRLRLAAASAIIALAAALLAVPSAATADGPTTFANTAPVAIPAAGAANQIGPAEPYPSTIVVSGMGGAVSAVSVTLSGLTHGILGDVDAMLVAPGGENLVFLSDVGAPGSFASASNADLTFADTAVGSLAPAAGAAVAGGTYLPTNVDAGSADTFAAPAPSPSVQTSFAGAFQGISPNGTWSLYLVDDATGDLGSLAGGWSLTITTTVTDAATSTTLTGSPSPATTGAEVTFTATVTSSGSAVTSGAVQFRDGATALGGPVAVSASGVATFATSALAEGTHTIFADYSGASGFLSSSGSFSQRIDNATVVNGTTYCNPGTITVPGAGPSTPYPSNISVSGLPSSLSDVDARISGLSHTSPADLDIMLVGPSGTNVMLLSDAGGATPVSNATIDFDDEGAVLSGSLSTGAFQPVDVDTDADAAFPAPAPAYSGLTALSTFDGTDPNGTWSLWVVDDATGDSGSVSGGWCLTFEAVAPPAPVDITLVSINDFHGRIDDNTVKWAGTIEQIIAGSNGNVAITGAGDLVGASLFPSAVANDQPTIDVMNAIGLDASAVGNHEFDKGWPDLRDRIIGAPGARNAEWDYLGANVYDSVSGATLLPEYATLTFEGVRVAVIGAVTEETPSLVSPAGMVGVTIGDPVEAVNRVAAELSDGDETNGEAEVLVATFHEGAPSGALTLEENIAASATFDDIVNGVSPEVDVLFNGHTHQAYVYSAPVPGVPGATRPVLQTGSYGDFVGEVKLSVDRDTGAVTIVSARNVPRSTTANATLIEQFPQLAEVDAIVRAALANAAIIGETPVGRVSSDITTAYANGSFGPTGYQAVRDNTNRDQRNLESTLGGLVANALYDTLAPLGTDLPTDAATIGVANPGGLRAELFYPAAGPEGDGVVTYAEANGVLPFVNNLWTTHLTGAQVKTMLEQQWQSDGNGNVPTRAYLQLGLSDNVSYTFDPALPEGSRITSITVDGQAIDPAATYKIATFAFLVAGGDNFRVFTDGIAAADTGLVDRDAWIGYLQARQAAPGIAPDFARRSTAVSPLPTTLTRGALLSTTLSYLDLTSLGTPQSTTVDVAVGGISLGSAATTFVPSPSGNAAPADGLSGTATVSLTVPGAVPSGAHTLTFTVQPTGTVITVPVVVNGPVTVDAGGPYTIAEGDDLVLDASATTHGGTYEWDLDGDGDFTDASGLTPTMTWAQLEPLGIDDGPSDHTVTFRATIDGGTTTTTAPLHVDNTAPTSVLTGSLTATAGVLFTIKVGADDPSSADMAALFTYIVDWGDGSPVETVIGPADPPVSHTYTTAGTFAASFVSVDKDGGTGDPTSVSVLADPATPPDTGGGAPPAGGGGALPATGSELPVLGIALASMLVALGAGILLTRPAGRRRGTSP